MLLQVASCERTKLPSGEAAAAVKHLVGQQQQFEAAMQVVNLGSRTGAKSKRKTGEPQLRYAAVASMSKQSEHQASTCLYGQLTSPSMSAHSMLPDALTFAAPLHGTFHSSYAGQASETQMPRYNVPVSFVSKGCMNSDSLEMRPPMQAAQVPLEDSSVQEPAEAEAGPSVDAAASSEHYSSYMTIFGCKLPVITFCCNAPSNLQLQQ